MYKNKLISIFSFVINPNEVFCNNILIKAWWVPLFFVISIYLLCGILTKNVVQTHQLNTLTKVIESDRNISKDQKQKIIRQSHENATINWFITYLIGAFTVVVFVSVNAGLIYLVSLKIGGTANFVETFGFYSYCSIIDAYSAVFKSILIIITNSLDIHIGLDVLIKQNESNSVFYILTTKIDAFMIWQIILMIIGLSHINQFSRIKSMIFVLIYWCISMVLGVTTFLLFSNNT